jgi:hypothetical protein
MHLLEPETAREFESGMRSNEQNVAAPAEIGSNESGELVAPGATRDILPL